MKNKLKIFFKERILGEKVNEVNKEKSLITLFIYLVFIIIVFTFVRVNFEYNKNNSNNNTKQTQKLSKEDIIKNAFNNIGNTYKYNISVFNKNDNTYTNFNGDINNNINSGYKESDGIITNYKISDNNIINVDTNELIDDLYGNILYYFFDVNNIYEYVKDISFEEIKSDNESIYTYNSIYNDMNIKFDIKIEKNILKEIKYIYNNMEYKIVIS